MKKRLKKHISDYLNNNGKSTVHDIWEYCNGKCKLGYTIPEVSAVLKSDFRISEEAYVKNGYSIDKVKVWDLKEMLA